jgi:predicted permease
MIALFARWIVRLSARLVPAEFRDRWREEWLAELEAGASRGRGHTLGAPRDALLTRWSMRDRRLWARVGWAADLRDAWRALRRTPLQTAAIVACLTLGSVLAVLMFGVINAALAGALPGVVDRHRLVRIGVAEPSDGRTSGITMGAFRTFPEALPGLKAHGGELPWRFSVSVGDEALVADGSFVTGTFFPVLGTTAIAGRLIQPADDRPDAPPVVVISHAFWLKRFGGRTTALGSVIHIADAAYQVIGVLPPGFVGLDAGHPGETAAERDHLWLPMNRMWTYPGYPAASVDFAVGPLMIGRLEDGVSRVATARIVGTVDGRYFPRARAQNAEPSGGRLPIRIEPFALLFDDGLLQTAFASAILMAVPLIVLGIACANVAGVQLARALSRTHELAIRVSLGASRQRVVRLLVIETGVLALAAGGAAWAIAAQVLRYSEQLMPFPVHADSRVFLFSILLPVAVTVAAGLAPAWRATGFDVQAGLRHGARVGRVASHRLRRGVVVAQIAASVFLLMVAALVVKSVRTLPDAIGALRDDVFVAEVALGDPPIDEARRAELRPAVQAEVARVPGVSVVAVSSGSLTFSDGLCWVPGAQPSMTMASGATAVSASYFDALGLATHVGRTFRDEERTVVVVNAAFASALPAGTSAVGSTIQVRRRDAATREAADIVGVVDDGYERAPRGFPRPRCYLPIGEEGTRGFTLIARGSDAVAVGPAIERALRRVHPNLAPREAGTIAALMGRRYRFLSWTGGALAAASGLALLLSSVGLFAVLSYAVTLRTAEFGIRLALGAHPRSVTGIIMREALLLTVVGTILGIILSLPMARLLSQSVLTTISWQDPIPPLVASGVLVVVGVFATWLPARRVSRIAPVVALRQD